MRRCLCVLLLLVFLSGSVFAFVAPVAVGAGIMIAAESTAVSGAVAAGWAAVAALVGVAVGYIAFADDAGAPPVYLRLSDDAPIPAPAGWSGGENGSDPVAPSVPALDPPVFPAGTTFSRCTRYRSNGVVRDDCGALYGSLAECQAGFLVSGDGGGYIRYCKSSDGGFITRATSPDTELVPSNAMSPDGGCAAGYTQSGSVCNPAPNAPFPPDETLIINMNNGNYAVHPRDSIDSANIPVTVNADSVSYNNGANTLNVTTTQTGVRVNSSTLNPDGSITQAVYDLVKQGDSYVLAGGTTSNVPGGVGTNPGANVDPENSTATTKNCGGPGQPACNVDVDDWGFSGKGDHSDDVRQMNDSAVQHLTQIDTTADDGLDISHSWLPSLFPGDPVVCRPLVFNSSITHGSLSGLSASAELDICDKVLLVRQVLAWVFGISTVIYIFRAFSRANAAGA